MTIYVVQDQFPYPGHDVVCFKSIDDARAYVQNCGLVFPLIRVRSI